MGPKAEPRKSTASLHIHTLAPTDPSGRPKFRIDAFGPMGVNVGLVAFDGSEVTWMNARERRAGHSSGQEPGLGGIIPIDLRARDIFQILTSKLSDLEWACKDRDSVTECVHRQDTKQRVVSQRKTGGLVLIEIKTSSGEVELSIEETVPKVQPLEKLFKPEAPKGWKLQT